MTDPVAIRTVAAQLRARDVAMLPTYEHAAVSLRPSPASIANGTRPPLPRPERATSHEDMLRHAQMDYYRSQQAHDVMHSFEYDPCRSK